jgi:glycosyltransferase involved in cell wall biosynthesis
MISILIPAFNCDVRELVEALSTQCAATGTDFEILVMDDASLAQYQRVNLDIADLPGVDLEIMTVNQGRARIRNRLAAKARYEFLLFIDGDARVIKPNFVQNYLDHLQPGMVVCGGCNYPAEAPKGDEFTLHWYYGTHREQQPANIRQRRPWQRFMTFNFAIPKDTFMSIRFDETIRHYGHEDTVFGSDLETRRIPVVHIDNPLEHIGIEAADTYLRKSQLAIDNLVNLWRKGKPIETRLIRVYQKLRYWKVMRPLRWLYQWLEPFVDINLRSPFPFLTLFDYFKLVYLDRTGFGNDLKRLAEQQKQVAGNKKSNVPSEV